MSGTNRSIAFVASGVLLILALIYAGTAALFALLASSGRRSTLRIVDDIAVLHSDFAYEGLATFLVLCLIATYAGLAAIRNWRGARLVAAAAGGATIALGLHGLWVYASMLAPGIPRMPFSIGIQASPAVSLALCILGIIVLCGIMAQTPPGAENGPRGRLSKNSHP